MSTLFHSKDAEEQHKQPLTTQPQNGHEPAIDPATLNEKQRLTYDIVTSH